MNKKTLRYGVGAIFIIILIWVASFMIINKEELFKNEIILTYESGCTETYINNELVTPECIKPQGYQRDNQWAANINLTQI